MAAAIDVTDVAVLDGYVVLLRFSDQSQRVINLEPLMRGPVFDEVRDRGLMPLVSVDAELGTIVWPNGADLPPQRLREESFSLEGLRRIYTGPRPRLAGSKRPTYRHKNPFEKLTALKGLPARSTISGRVDVLQYRRGAHLVIDLAAPSYRNDAGTSQGGREKEAVLRFRATARTPVAS